MLCKTCTSCCVLLFAYFILFHTLHENGPTFAMSALGHSLNCIVCLAMSMVRAFGWNQMGCWTVHCLQQTLSWELLVYSLLLVIFFRVLLGLPLQHGVRDALTPPCLAFFPALVSLLYKWWHNFEQISSCDSSWLDSGPCLGLFTARMSPTGTSYGVR